MRQMLAFLIGCLGLSQVASTQVASYKLFGSGCSHTTVQPLVFRNIGTPRLGSTFWIETQSTVPPIGASNDYFVLTGFSKTNHGPLRLPFDSSVLTGLRQIWCGNLYVSIAAI